MTPGKRVTGASVGLSVYAGQTHKLCDLSAVIVIIRNLENRGTSMYFEERQIKDRTNLPTLGHSTSLPGSSRNWIGSDAHGSEDLGQQMGDLIFPQSASAILFPKKLDPCLVIPCRQERRQGLRTINHSVTP